MAENSSQSISSGSKSQNPSTKPSPSTPRVSRVRWASPPDYDDEELLIKIRLTNPQLGWAEITKLFNLEVPPKRWRTADAITTKGNTLMRAHGYLPTRTPPAVRLEIPDDWGQVSDSQNLSILLLIAIPKATPTSSRVL